MASIQKCERAVTGPDSHRFCAKPGHALIGGHMVVCVQHHQEYRQWWIESADVRFDLFVSEGMDA